MTRTRHSRARDNKQACRISSSVRTTTTTVRPRGNKQRNSVRRIQEPCQLETRQQQAVHDSPTDRNHKEIR